MPIYGSIHLLVPFSKSYKLLNPPVSFPLFWYYLVLCSFILHNYKFCINRKKILPFCIYKSISRYKIALKLVSFRKTKFWVPVHKVHGQSTVIFQLCFSRRNFFIKSHLFFIMNTNHQLTYDRTFPLQPVYFVVYSSIVHCFN